MKHTRNVFSSGHTKWNLCSWYDNLQVVQDLCLQGIQGQYVQEVQHHFPTSTMRQLYYCKPMHYQNSKYLSNFQSVHTHILDLTNTDRRLCIIEHPFQNLICISKAFRAEIWYTDLVLLRTWTCQAVPSCHCHALREGTAHTSGKVYDQDDPKYYSAVEPWRFVIVLNMTPLWGMRCWWLRYCKSFLIMSPRSGLWKFFLSFSVCLVDWKFLQQIQWRSRCSYLMSFHLLLLRFNNLQPLSNTVRHSNNSTGQRKVWSIK